MSYPILWRSFKTLGGDLVTGFAGDPEGDKETSTWIREM